MSKTLFWLQCGGCGGDTMALLNLGSPDILELLGILKMDILWHPSFSNESQHHFQELITRLLSGEQKLDILCIEGAIIRGPGGSGTYEVFNRKPKKDLVAALAKKADYVIAVGTCASFGGIGTGGEVEATGLQFHKSEKGGFLGRDFTGQAGLPVINLPGCPCHGEVVAGMLSALSFNLQHSLNEYNSPLQWYGMMVHQGCIRNEYHEYRIEEDDFGQRGCLYFHMGCRGPLTHGPCNKILWNGRSSKTFVGVPCFGCTHPDFPQSHPFFVTRNIAGIPLELPEGVDRAHYQAYKGMAASAAPNRLKERKTRI
ncbi:MAG: NADH:ubiquinone oxidoreductase [Deltaproteobacteria bacterium]|nr:NADH:ubiquinone oxidoreductase [Deltaproteobacteria bacterium]MBT4091285.1 NADH:ubiquinone oxidoreductase [Deltaproteobacteria bacterium]MBT4265220.1 NADH:ubiquinone oxidoreductase [Deltaproteobacteria bacterium]MBT4638150.1 NADH:ubiquinone oxidoreductase [Deltaproteobacteria bacterium]MBT6504294.1 NADH:ubiquinone oxidoreductase [Deltaproteobacteria bacterium]